MSKHNRRYFEKCLSVVVFLLFIEYQWGPVLFWNSMTFNISISILIGSPDIRREIHMRDVTQK